MAPTPHSPPPANSDENRGLFPAAPYHLHLSFRTEQGSDPEDFRRPRTRFPPTRDCTALIMKHHLKNPLKKSKIYPHPRCAVYITPITFVDRQADVGWLGGVGTCGRRQRVTPLRCIAVLWSDGLAPCLSRTAQNCAAAKFWLCKTIKLFGIRQSQSFAAVQIRLTCRLIVGVTICA